MSPKCGDRSLIAVVLGVRLQCDCKLRGMRWARKIVLNIVVVLTAFYASEAMFMWLVPPWDEGFGANRWLTLTGLNNTALLSKALTLEYFSYTEWGTRDLSSFPLLEWDIWLFSEHWLAFYLHVVFGPIALLLGLFQLWPSFRSKRPLLHRWLGRFYLLSQVLSLPAGMYLSQFEYAGLEAMYGFFGMGGTTLLCSAMAYRSIRNGDIQQHREWMIRSYWVMWSSVVLFRLAILLWIPAEVRRNGGHLPGDFRAPYVVCIFFSWSLALLAADVYLSLTKSSPAKQKVKER